MKAVIVGLFNPKSQDPAYAMEPFTPNGSGERLWKMLSEVVPVTKQDYVGHFEMINVIDTDKVTWEDVEYFEARAIEIERRVESRPAAVLGIMAWTSLRVERSPIRKTDWFGHYKNWWLLPHPSGLCRVYNDPVMRRRAGEALAKIGGLL